MIKEELIKRCRKNDRRAQRELYDHLSSMLYFTCRRYLKNEHDADDALAESFVIIFTKLHQLKDPKALEGWAKRITVNQCLQKIKKSVNFNLYIDEVKTASDVLLEDSVSLEHQDLLKLVTYLPDGCKTVFNLFVIEGFSHKDIAEELGISVGTSKSQLNVARTKLMDLVNQFYFSKAN